MGILKDLNIVKGKNNVASNIFEELHPSFMTLKYSTPSDYVEKFWSRYTAVRTNKVSNAQALRGINGKIFEYILATLLIREKICPIFLSAKVAFVPNINYDIMLYSSDRGPICLSAKTSFRERYKQADLEAIALKYVHRRAESYLITMSSSDASDVNKKKKVGDVIGLDEAICATENSFDSLILRLKTYNFTPSPKITVLESNQIVSEEIIRQSFPNY